MIDPIHSTFRICCWSQCQCGFSFSFSSFSFVVKISFLQFCLDMDYRLKANTSFGIYFFMGLLCRVNLFIAFILEESPNIYVDLFVISLCACCFSHRGRIMIMVWLKEVGVCFLSQPP